MEIEVSESTKGCANATENDGRFPLQVPPGASGEGLPYAPENWPHPGDVWTWKVGNKINTLGYYVHRFLLVPKRLQKSPTRKIWLGSQVSTIRYLQSQFPNADIDAFFASFTWQIPAETRSPGKAQKRSSKRKATPKNKAESGSRSFRRNTNASKKCIRLIDQDTTTLVDLPSAEGFSAGRLYSDGTGNKKGQAFDLDAAICTEKGATGQSADLKLRNSNSRKDDVAEMTSEDFDIYLSSLDGILSQSASRAPNSGSALLETGDFTKAREELSSLLTMNFPSLITSNKVPEVTSLSSKIRSDPNLSPTELSMLNLIQEIPSAGKQFLNAQQVTAEASKFFEELDSNKAVVNVLKSKYMSSKDKMALAQAENASASSIIQEIDDQIATLQSRRAALVEVVEKNQTKIAELATTQKRVSDNLPKIVNEVQVANSERSEWELKQKKTAEQEAQILAKFAPLEGFSFVRLHG